MPTDPSEPSYPDRSHPIYRALPIAEALDRLNERYEDTELDGFADGELQVIEPVLVECGDAAGGLSISGFRHDLLLHVEHASAAAGDAEYDRACENAAQSRRDEGYGSCPKRGTDRDDRVMYQAVWDAAEQWMRDVAATMKFFGMGIVDGVVVETKRIAGSMTLNLHAIPRSAHGRLNYDKPTPTACARFVANWDWLSDTQLADLIARNITGDTMLPLLRDARDELQAEGLR